MRVGCELLVAVLSLASFACGGSATGGTSGSGGTVGAGGEGGDCQEVSAGGSGGERQRITIRGQAFSPDNLDVAPGEQVLVDNQDDTPHSVTSERNPGDFTTGAANGVFFDTGTFSRGTRIISIPWSAQTGAVVHYFCSVRKGQMAGD